MSSKERADAMQAWPKMRVFLCGLSIVVVALLSMFLVWALYGFASDGDPLREAGFYSLAISVLILEATIAIALVVFGLQGRREAEQRKLRSYLAAEIVFADIEIAFQYLLLVPDGAGMPGAAAPLKSGFDSHLADLKQVLSADAMHTLIMLVSATQDPSFADDERYCNGGLPVVALPFIREPLRPIAQTSYARLLEAVGDWRDLLDAETFGLIDELARVCGESWGEYKADQGIFADKDGVPVIAFDQQMGRCCLYDQGVLVCDGLVDPDRARLDDLIYEGFVRRPDYIGGLREGEMHGYGKRVSRYDGSVLAEGEWFEGELLSGTEFNWIVAIPERGSLEGTDGDTSTARIRSKWFQIGKDYFAAHHLEDIAKEVSLRHLPFESDEDRAALDGLEIMYVADMEVDGDMERLTNIRRLDDVVDISATRARLEEMAGNGA